MTVTFNRNVTATGAPQLALTIGSADAAGGRTSSAASGNRELEFRYVVAAGDADAERDQRRREAR